MYILGVYEVFQSGTQSLFDHQMRSETRIVSVLETSVPHPKCDHYTPPPLPYLVPYLVEPRPKEDRQDSGAHSKKYFVLIVPVRTEIVKNSGNSQGLFHDSFPF